MAEVELDRREALVLVEWGDPSGADGFVEHHGDGGAAPTAYVRVTERLLENRIPQPPPDLPDPETDPAWTLVDVEVEGRQYWCFIVQGRGRAFGRAGGCQFLYGACANYRPDELWRVGAAAVEPGGRLRLRQQAPPLPLLDSCEVDVQAARDLVHGLAHGREVVELDLGPADCASLFAASFAVLPDGVVRTRTWSTMPPRTRNSRGPLWVTTRVTTRTVALAEPLAPPADRRDARAAVWLAGQITRWRPFSPELQHASSMAAVFDVVARELLPLDPEDVPRLLADRARRGNPSPHSRLGAADGLAAVRQWACAHPQPALDAFGRVAADDNRVATALGHGLLEAVETDQLALAELRLPPLAEPETGWHAALASAIRAAYPEPASRVAWLERHLIAEGGLLADQETRWRHRAWLLTVWPDANVSAVFPSEYFLADAIEGDPPLSPQLVGDARASASVRARALDRCATLGAREIVKYLGVAGLDGDPDRVTLIGEALVSRDGDDAYLLALLFSPELAPWQRDLVTAIDAFLAQRTCPTSHRLHFALLAARESLPSYQREWATLQLETLAVAAPPPDTGSAPEPLPVTRTSAVEPTPAAVRVPDRRRHAVAARIDRAARLVCVVVFVLLTVATVAAVFLYYRAAELP